MQPEERRSLISWSLAAVAANSDGVCTGHARFVTTGSCRMFERNSEERVLQYAQKQTCNRSNDNAADRAPLDIVHPSPANTTTRWSEQDAAAKTKTDNGGSGVGR